VAVTVKNYVFCYATPYSLADVDRRFEEHHCPHLWSIKRIRDHVKIQGHDDRIQICEFLAPLCLHFYPNPPVRSQGYVRTPDRYYILRYQMGRQRMQLNGCIPTTEHFTFNRPNGPTMSR